MLSFTSLLVPLGLFANTVTTPPALLPVLPQTADYLAQPRTGNYPVVFRLVIPDQFYIDVRQNAPVTNPMDPIPLPADTRKGQKY